MSNTLTAVLVASLQLTHLATESLGRFSGRTSRASGLLAATGLLLGLASGCAVGPVGQSGRTAPDASPAAASPPPSARPVASGGTASSNPLLPPPTPTPGPAVASDLLLTGPLSGRVQNAQPLGSCGRGPVGFAVALRFTVGSTPYVLSVDVLDYRGPGSYNIPPERVAIRSDAPGGTPTFLPATSGTVEVAAGETSGKLDARLGSDGAGHLQGGWACR
jgi:hypothetical protein